MGDPGRRGREEKRFVELYESAYSEVLRYARRRVDEDAARDAAAETFLVAWRRLDVIPAEPLPWLYGVTRGVLANEFRRSWRQSRTARRIASSAREAPRDHSDRIGEVEVVTAALATLSEGDREVISLVAWEGLEPQAAAQVLGCSAGAFAVRLHRARQRLQLALADQEAKPPPAGVSSSAPVRARKGA
ncbi:MAG TPA: sigma-70 family RNA polymerase sigma factor [Solirubrobacteraceae bacterium]